MTEAEIAYFKNTIPGWEWWQEPAEAEALERVRSVLETEPGLTFIRLAERVDGVGRQRMSRLVRKWERAGHVKTVEAEGRGHGVLVYLADQEPPDPTRERREMIPAYIDRNPGCSWAQICSDLRRSPSKQERQKYLGPLIESGQVLALGRRLFPGDRFTRQSALSFIYPDLLEFIREHPGCSTTEVTKGFGPSARETLRRLDDEGVLRHTEGRTRGAVTHYWYEVDSRPVPLDTPDADRPPET
jgi:hypothetical protein